MTEATQRCSGFEASSSPSKNLILSPSCRRSSGEPLHLLLWPHQPSGALCWSLVHFSIWVPKYLPLGLQLTGRDLADSSRTRLPWASSSLEPKRPVLDSGLHSPRRPEVVQISTQGPQPAQAQRPCGLHAGCGTTFPWTHPIPRLPPPVNRKKTFSFPSQSLAFSLAEQ